MRDGLMKMAQAQCATESLGGQYIPPSIRKQLQDKRDVLAKHLQSIDEAIAALDENPAFERVHDILSKVL